MASRTWRWRAALRGALIVIAGTAAAVHAAETDTPEGADPIAPAYVGSSACAECHADQTVAWTDSPHHLAWTQPTASNVLGDFNTATSAHRGMKTTFTRRDNTFYIESVGPDDQMTRWPVAGVVGTSPVQQYLIETEPGRLQSFDLAWDTVGQRWFQITPEDALPAANGDSWTGPYRTWNARCAECHSTNFSRNYDAETQRYASTAQEIGVGCEACHGPASAHLDWAQRRASSDNADPPEGLGPTGLTIDFKPTDPNAEIELCASCHAARSPLFSHSPVPGTPFNDALVLSTLRPPLYYPDGQIMGEAYEYGSFLQSSKQASGVTCSDCHEVHGATPVATGNAVCTACHSPGGTPDFPDLRRAPYDSPDHHFHPEGSDGAQCVSCHMAARDVMGVDRRHDHSFRVPRPDLTVATGAPNACTDCHAAEGPYWAQEELDRRFPNSAYREAPFAAVFHAAQGGEPTGSVADVGDDLAKIALAETLPGIVRATALELLAPSATPEQADRLAGLLNDPDPLVRSNALAIQRPAPLTDMVERVWPLLMDDVRVVRITAAREMLAVSADALPAEVTEALSTAMEEWQATLASNADYPETQMILGGMAMTKRDLPGALEAFREAVRMDPHLAAAWSMLVRLQSASGEEDLARETLDEALTKLPEDPGLLSLDGQLP
ncbi:multiheme c-type cytochrome [Tropicimonas isoalkanivorans]|uniref:Tetratricopeptide repeat-containing protein n=1 Tax=Tropicimonas isoalkanivorans TaxID=441112 RepID=A0A1I1D7Q1_9RHOB|nr:multiheme c-type cytochrome [Tropicimonas isoalkanivorans]SFB70837.1 Tetratricopeptide repeat-containing protein [Tropicimonas isoalkanivorans]